MAVLVAHVGQTAAGLPQCPRFSRQGKCHSDAYDEVTTRRLVPQAWFHMPSYRPRGGMRFYRM